MLGSRLLVRLLHWFYPVSKPYRYARKDKTNYIYFETEEVFQNLIGMLGRVTNRL